MFRILISGLILSGFGAAASAEGDPSMGERVFRKCRACHQVGPEAINGTGPILNGIVGAEAGRNQEFSYSDAFSEHAAAGLTWDAENLGAFLSKPRDFIPGTAMAFSGLRRESEIADLIAYLETFGVE